MRLNKECIKRGMILFSVFTFLLAMVGLFPIGMQPQIDVKAADPVSVELTVEQALALYGTTIQGSWYSSSLSAAYPIKFHFGGTSMQWLPDDYTGGYSLYTAGSTGYGSNPTLDSVRSHNYLVYYAINNYKMTSSIFEDWGGYGKQWKSYNGSGHTNLLINHDFSISLEGITGITQNVMYSGIMTFQWNTPDDDARYSYIISNFSYNPNYRTNTLYYSRSGYNFSFRRILTPVYKKNYDSDIIDESREICLFNTLISPSFDGTSFDYTSQRFNFNCVQAFDASGKFNVYPNDDNIHYPDGTEVVYLFIQPPVLLDYDWQPFPEPATGTGVTETLPPQYTVNLSNLETGVADLIRQEQNNNALLRVQISQLNTIIEQLNAIYQAMVDRGEIAVDLVQAENYPTLNSSILQQVGDSITTYTHAQLPSGASNGGDFINSAASELGLYSQPWLGLGIFCVSFTIFCWVIFRGRGA